MGFRMHSINPYKISDVNITPEIREAEKNKDVWNRLFDFEKYRVHTDALKISTGIALMDVEPFPRLKLMKLYYITLDEVKDLPDKYGYKRIIQEFTRYRMKVVDENLSIKEIEKRIGHGIVEELILQAHNEIKLIRIMKEWQPWDQVFDEEDDQLLYQSMANFRYDNPFPYKDENHTNEKHERGPRSNTANIHPEDLQKDTE